MSMVLRALRMLPNVRGKARLARALLSHAERSRETFLVDRHGNRLVVPNLLEPLGFSLAINGSYEPGEMDFLRRHVNQTSAFLDIGANIGAFTVGLAAHAERVIAIEASPAVLPFLRRNVEMSQRTNIVVVDCAASAPGIESVPFYLPPMDHFGMGSSAPQFYADPITVPARTIDSILLSRGVDQVSAIKIDVEGYEAHVFLGAEATLRSRSRPIVLFEYNEWAEERAFPGQRGSAQEILIGFGYRVWILEDYLRGKPPLTGPVVEGCHSMVAVGV